jgi:general stress protein YciG
MSMGLIHNSKKMAIADRGFASMDPKKQKAIASKGGKTVSQNKAHMAAIGRKGGISTSKDKAHMAKIGRKGGKA